MLTTHSDDGLCSLHEDNSLVTRVILLPRRKWTNPHRHSYCTILYNNRDMVNTAITQPATIGTVLYNNRGNLPFITESW